MNEVEEEPQDSFFSLSSKKFIFIIFAVNILLVSFILLPKVSNQLKIEEKMCLIKEKRIEEKKCQTSDCKGKGRKTKCKTISYPCFYWTISAQDLSDSNFVNITTKFPTKFKKESQKEVETYNLNSNVPCYFLNSEYSLEKPSITNHLLFSIVYLILVGIALYSIHFYTLKSREYKYKSGLSKKDLKKPIKKAKVKFN